MLSLPAAAIFSRTSSSRSRIKTGLSDKHILAVLPIHGNRRGKTLIHGVEIDIVITVASLDGGSNLGEADPRRAGEPNDLCAVSVPRREDR